MADDFLLEMALRHFGFSDTEIAQINAAILKAAYVTRLVKDHKTVINELIDVANMVAARVAQKENQ